jgi:hypothetical protein
MAYTFAQSQVDAAVTYLMAGGPNGGELTTDQYFYMIRNTQLKVRTSVVTDFGWQIQLAINQGHAGLSNSKNICRDQWGALNDVMLAAPPSGSSNEGIGNNDLARFNVSISG